MPSVLCHIYSSFCIVLPVNWNFFLSVNNDFLLRCGVKGLIYDLIFRVAALTKLPRAVIEESEELQVGIYK